MSENKNPCTPYPAYRDIDESKLDRIDRLGLAYCRLGRFEWDDLIGPKPEGFDDLPNYLPTKVALKRRKLRREGRDLQPLSKSECVGPPMKAIETIIGDSNTLRCLWLFERGRTEEEWFRWYVNERFKHHL